MDIAEEMLASDRYKRRIQRFSSETLRLAIKDRSKALDYARKAIKEREADNLTDQYVEAIVNVMQKVAKIVLEKRAKKYKYSQSIKPEIKKIVK